MIERLHRVPAVPNVEVELVERRTPEAHGFLELHAERLALRPGGGEASEPFDYYRVERRALDAVVVLPYFFSPASEDEATGGRASSAEEVWVVLRSAVRPPVSLRLDHPLFGPAVGSGFWEVPAGLIEAGEESESGQRLAALRELSEETGLSVRDDALEHLGPLSYPCPGVIGERQTFFCARVDPDHAQEPSLDGSALESVGRVIAVPLRAALRAATEGLVGDMKSELCLRRLEEKFRA